MTCQQGYARLIIGFAPQKWTHPWEFYFHKYISKNNLTGSNLVDLGEESTEARSGIFMSSFFRSLKESWSSPWSNKSIGGPWLPKNAVLKLLAFFGHFSGQQKSSVAIKLEGNGRLLHYMQPYGLWLVDSCYGQANFLLLLLDFDYIGFFHSVPKVPLPESICAFAAKPRQKSAGNLSFT